MFELLGICVAVLAALIALQGLATRLLPRRVDYDCRRADAYEGEGALSWSRAYFREWRVVQIRFRWEPYAYWRSARYEGEFISVGEDGIRATWNPPPACGVTPLQIFLLGGSTMWGAGVQDSGTIPSLLSRILERERIAARVVNLGQVGYVSTQEVITLLRLLQAGNRPDLVIFYDGYNDVLSAAMNGRAGLTYQEQNRAREFNLLKSRWAMSVNAMRSLVPWGPGAESGRPRRSLPPVTDPVDLGREVAAVEVANLNAVRALGREFGFAVRFFWQPTIFQKQVLTEYERGQRTMLAPAQQLFAETEGHLRRWSNGQNDRTMVFLGDLFVNAQRPYFIDWAHITEEGNEIVARRMLSEVAPQLEALLQARKQ